MVSLQHKNPCPGGHEIYHFGRPLCGHHYYILSLSNLCLSILKIHPDFKKKPAKQYLCPFSEPL